MDLFVGIDLAWKPRARTGLAVVGASGRLIDSTTVVSDDQIGSWIGGLPGRPVVVAVDAPLVVPNATGQRVGKDLVARAYARYGASPYPSNRANPLFDPPRAMTLAERLGWDVDPASRGSAAQPVSIEVYPHPAMVGLFRLGSVLPYKSGRGRTPEARRSTFRELLAHLEAIEDELDAILCAHLAWLLWTGDDRRAATVGGGCLTVLMQVIEGGVEEMSGGELLDHLDLLEVTRRRVDVETLRAAVRHAVLHGPETLDPKVARLRGRERAVRLGGVGTPLVAEFAGATFAGRLKISDYAGRAWMADGLDLVHRFPRVWARVQALEVKVSYARYVAQQCRQLSVEQAAYVDARVAQAADGRIPWARFELLVAGAVTAADPVGAAERERRAAEDQFARKTPSNEGGVCGFYIRARFAVIAWLDATVAYLAEALRVMGDDAPLDARRVTAVLIMANPAYATEFLGAYQAWKDRPADPAMPTDETAPPPPDRHGLRGTDAERTGERPSIDSSKLLPTMVLYLHLYRSQLDTDAHDGHDGHDGEDGRDGTGVVRVEGLGPVTEDWVRRFLGPDARFKVTPVIDLEGQAPVDAYEVPDRHRQAVHLMTPADIFPFSPNLTRTKQVDHTEPYQPGAAARGAGQSRVGQSRVGNYGPMTTFHHRIKTHGTWQVKQPFPGIYLWRDAHGAFYLVDHTGTRRTNGPTGDYNDDTGTSAPSPRRRTESRIEVHLAEVMLEWAA